MIVAARLAVAPSVAERVGSTRKEELRPIGARTPITTTQTKLRSVTVFDPPRLIIVEFGLGLRAFLIKHLNLGFEFAGAFRKIL